MIRSAWVAALLIVCLNAGRASAQDRPTVFIHGFGAEAADWAPTAERLKARIALAPHLPSLRWRESYSTQADELQARSEYRLLPSNTVAVGHSNGGIVSREWSKRHQLGGIVTIGTPHRGAPIFGQLLNWRLFGDISVSTLDRIINAFGRNSEWIWVYSYVDEALRWLADFNLWSFINLVTTLGMDAAMPVSTEVLADSPYLVGLNASSNLDREALAAPSRVGIVSVAHNFYFAGPARGIAPEVADTIAIGMYSAAYTMLFWGQYLLLHSPFGDWVAMNQAFSLIDGAMQILNIDPWYCRLVSSRDGSECLPNDGIVPAYSQTYPGVPNLIIGTNNDGPAHKQEKQKSDDALYTALVSYTQIPRRTAPPVVPVISPSPSPTPTPTPTPDPVPTPNPDPSPEPEPDPTPDPQPEPDPDDGPVLITSGELRRSQELHRGDCVTSTSQRFHLCYQGDGNLVLYDTGESPWRPMWASDTVGTSPGFVAMQGDGNFVLYDGDGVPRWASMDSLGHPDAWLAVQNDGNVVIYDPDGTPLWHTGTVVIFC